MWGSFFDRKTLRNALAGSGVACCAQAVFDSSLSSFSSSFLSLFCGSSVVSYMEKGEIAPFEVSSLSFIPMAVVMSLSTLPIRYFLDGLNTYSTAFSVSNGLVGSTCLFLSMISHVCANEEKSVAEPPVPPVLPAPKIVEPRIERMDVLPWEKGIKMCC